MRNAFLSLDRAAAWEHIGSIPLDFQTYHPQGLTFALGRMFLSSVEILEDPPPAGRDPDPHRRAPGRGRGHIFVLDGDGNLLEDIPVGEGDIYHPGGIDYDGSVVWISVAEYRPGQESIVYSLDPATLALTERFRVPDHISWVTSNAARQLVYGASWGSRSIYTWTHDGKELDRWENPSHFIDYQDCLHAGEGVIIASGISVLGGACAPFELGGFATVDVGQRRIMHEFPVPLYSAAGHVVTRNPFTASLDSGTLTVWVAPDDGDEPGGTRILRYATSVLNPIPRLQASTGREDSDVHRLPAETRTDCSRNTITS